MACFCNPWYSGTLKSCSDTLVKCLKKKVLPTEFTGGRSAHPRRVADPMLSSLGTSRHEYAGRWRSDGDGWRADVFAW